MIQYLGDYISKFRNVGWNHGNNVNFINQLIYSFEKLIINVFQLIFFKKNSSHL